MGIALARPLARGGTQEIGLVVAIVLLGVYFTSRNGVFISFDNPFSHEMRL